MPMLPPPDPNESFGEPSASGPLPRAMAVFPHGAANADSHRVADRILDLRPGLLVVVHDR